MTTLGIYSLTNIIQGDEQEKPNIWSCVFSLHTLISEPNINILIFNFLQNQYFIR